MRIVVALTGVSGMVYGVRFLQACRELKLQTELVISETAGRVLELELGKDRKEIEELADRSYRVSDLEAPISSGSQVRDAMVVIPCSMGTLAKIANGMSDNLITRAADVHLKQRRPLVLVVRETPLSLVHLENMVRVSRAGGIVLPAAPAFYHFPKSVDDLVDFVVGRVLDTIGISHDLYRRWRE